MKQWAGRAAAGALVTTLFVGAQVPIVANAADEPVPGTPTTGDTLFPNVGNSGYKVDHYDVDLTYFVGNTIEATTTIDATADHPLSSFSLDFEGLVVNSVSVDGVDATWTRDISLANQKHKLIITPATPISGEFTTEVTYSGTPSRHQDPDQSYEGWTPTSDGASAVGEPVGTMTWIPSNNTPADKATFDFSYTIPTAIGGAASAAAGNGELTSKVVSEDGLQTTWNWSQKNQMATYLAVVSIGKFNVYENDIVLTNSGRTIKEWSFVDSTIATATQTSINTNRLLIPDILNWMEANYGPYPGNSAGVIVDITNLGYALETQDRSYFENSMSRDTLIHELVHQWYGDDVSPKDWNDVWLNEGPAEYVNVQYNNAVYGAALPENSYYTSYASSSTTSTNWTVSTAAMTSSTTMFSGNVYVRGAWALEALRTAIGQANFKTFMKEWLVRYSGKSASTAQFIALAEEVSGKNLQAFFQDWVYDKDKAVWPSQYKLDITSSPAASVAPGGTISYTVTAANIGKVALTNGSVKIDITDLVTNATIDTATLPAGVVLDDPTHLTWTVPSTAVGSDSTITLTAIAGTVGAGSPKVTVKEATASLGVTLGTTSSTVEVLPASSTDAVATTAGTATVGSVLTADEGTWATGTTFTYQWFRGSKPIVGATSKTYTLTSADLAGAITVVVSGTTPGFASSSVTSSATDAVAVGTLTSTPVPTITGGDTAKVGVALTAVPGTWDAGTTFAYAWFADGVSVAGTTATYTPAAAVLGKVITVRVTGSKTGYTSVPQTSANSAAVAEGTIAASPVPTITGSATARVGTALTGAAGTWTNGTTLSYKWFADNVQLASTTTSFTPTTAELGKLITFSVTGVRAGYATVTRTSLETPAVAVGTFVLAPTPTITGNARIGSVLTVVPGTWDASTTLSYQWLVDGIAVAGATASTYTVAAGDLGLKVKVEVTGTKPGITTATKASASTAAVEEALLAQTLTPVPTVTTPRAVGATVTATPGTWDEGVTLSYQWLVGGVEVEGATGSTYTPVAADQTKTIVVKVTGKKSGYNSVTTTSVTGASITVGTIALKPVPTIEGTAAVGSLLTAVTGTWDDGVAFAYQWKSNGVNVVGATAGTYVVRAADQGMPITVTVTGTKLGYTTVTTAASAATAAAVRGTLVTAVPTFSATPKVDAAVTADLGSWTTGTTFKYQWSVAGTPVSGATASSFTPTVADFDKAITVAITGSKVGYTTVTRTSEAETVIEGDLVDSAIPTITGQAAVDQELTAVTDGWDAGVLFAYQWSVDGDEVDGATEETYTVLDVDLGKKISVEVVGSKPGYSPVTASSVETLEVAAGVLVDTAVPTITGTVQVAKVLTAGTDGWDAGVDFEYQWSAGGIEIDGADEETYTVAASDLGKVITVTVVGSKVGYAPVTLTSIDTDAVVAGNLVATPNPTISGTPKVATTLTAVPGTWDAGVTLTYAWFVDGDVVAGATGSTYAVRTIDEGYSIKVIVTGTKAGYVTVAAPSAASALVTPGSLVKTPQPTITGTKTAVGATLVAVAGSWDSSTALTYQWYANGKVITGATKFWYTPTAAELGKTLQVAVTGTKAHFHSVSKASVSTAKIVAGKLTKTGTPSISGTAKVHKTLKVKTWTWDAGVTFSYRWYANGKSIPTAVKSSYNIQKKYQGDKITVKVTGKKAGYVTVVKTSPSTKKVAK